MAYEVDSRAPEWAPPDLRNMYEEGASLGAYELILRTKKRGVNAELYTPAIILKPAMIILEEGCRLDGMIKIEGGRGVRIGKGVHVSSFAHINVGGGEVVLGDYCAICSGAKVIGGSNMMVGRAMSAAAPRQMQAVHRGRTVIGRYAFVGTNAVVLYDLEIGEGAVIGAGAVVTHDVPPWEVWIGNPARRIGWREH